MFIHIGGDEVVLTKDVIMILDKSALCAKDTSSFLQIAKEEGFVRENKDLFCDEADSKKTAVIMDNKVLFSPISATTLSKRADFIKNLR